MLFDRQLQILVAKKKLFITTFIKTILTEISPGMFFKLPFKVFFFNFMFKDKLYVVLFIVYIYTYIFEE
jgi:hypothetical protein